MEEMKKEISNMTTEEKKQELEKLENLINKANEAIYQLKDSMQSYYIGIIDCDYYYYRVRFGYTTENNALKQLEESSMTSDCLGFNVVEITEEENSLYHELECVTEAISLLGSCTYCDDTFLAYKEMSSQLEERGKQLKEKLGFPPCTSMVEL